MTTGLSPSRFRPPACAGSSPHRRSTGTSSLRTKSGALVQTKTSRTQRPEPRFHFRLRPSTSPLGHPDRSSEFSRLPFEPPPASEHERRERHDDNQIDAQNDEQCDQHDLPSFLPGAHLPGKLTSSRNSPPGEYPYPAVNAAGQPASQGRRSSPRSQRRSLIGRYAGTRANLAGNAALGYPSGCHLPGGSPAATARQEPSQPTGPCHQRPVTSAPPADR